MENLADPIVQYIAVRSDLKWPKGALIAQGSHASVAAIHLNYDDPDTKAYLQSVDSMHKIVVAIPSLTEIKELDETLLTNNIKFKLWTEQPENIPTCLATKPYSKKAVEHFFKSYKLFK
ncbi:peptidyl-tRNA hydrolase PTRHD1 [Brachionus plicatilis]|uniref:peptidyl-tRNA hydrolase n=1 Tax=Brachionus plicatilis TaxID=10195 RepID=A0A3M7SZR5_BRAPC|nr:peptidyl-tRNA hydrolase PTRHD1 [Brachionus plicatilis]